MRCPEKKRLQDAWHTHREAAMFLGCVEATTHQLLLRACQADQARAGRAIFAHRRQCASCSIPHQ